MKGRYFRCWRRSRTAGAHRGEGCKGGGFGTWPGESRQSLISQRRRQHCASAAPSAGRCSILV